MALYEYNKQDEGVSRNVGAEMETKGESAARAISPDYGDTTHRSASCLSRSRSCGVPQRRPSPATTQANLSSTRRGDKPAERVHSYSPTCVTLGRDCQARLVQVLEVWGCPVTG